MTAPRTHCGSGPASDRGSGRAPRRARLARLLLVVVLVVLGSWVATAPAAADICQDAPAPVAPKSGLPGMLTSVPKDVPDAAPDPFADPKVPIGDVYGYNWGWANFDLGCGSDFLRDPVAVSNTKSANVVMAGVGGVLAGLASLEQMAKSSSLDWLTTVVAGVADRLRGPLLGAWLPLALLGVGLIVGYKAKRASYADTMRTAVIILGAAAVATFALVFPAMASKAVDNAVVSVSTVVGKQFSASASDAVTRESAYRTWLAGNFGDPDSALARDLGPRLMSATRYTWSDMKRIQADPDVKKSIDTAKATEFKAVAQQIKERDPAAYEVFTGRGERTAPALLGVVVVLCMGLFVALSTLMVLIARVMMQGLALAAPLAAVLGILPTHNAVLARLWDLLTASMVAVAKFVVAGGVMALVLGAIQSNAALGAGPKLFWVIVATAVAIVLTRPVRSLKTILPGVNPDRSYLRSAMNGVATYVGARMGAEDGVRSGSFASPGAALADQPHETRPHTYADARESLEALPAPAWTSAASDRPGPVWTQVPTAAGGTVAGGAAVLSAPRTPTNSGEWARGQSWPGVVAAGSARRELEASPLPRSDDPVGAPLSVGSAVPVGAVPVGAGAFGAGAFGAGSLGAGRSGDPSAGGTDLHVGPLPVGSDTVVDSPTVGGGLTVVAPVPTPPTGHAYRPADPSTPETGGADVIYPSGVIVAAEEHQLYQRSHQASGPEVYVTLPERELAEDGSEHDMVTYHSRLVGSAGRHGAP